MDKVIYSNLKLVATPTESHHITTKGYIDDQITLVNGSTANSFSSASTYDIGDIVIYNGHIYKCKTAIATAGDWDSSKWDLVKVCDLISALEQTIKQSRYDTTITGNGSTTDFTITHNLGVQDVFVMVLDSSNNVVYTSVTLTDANTCSIGFATAPANNIVYRVVIRK